MTTITKGKKMRILVLIISLLTFSSASASSLNWENSPLNWDNSSLNWKNSSQNWDNSPMNWNNT